MTEKTRVKIYMNKGLGMSKGKYAAQAVHAALVLFGVHPGEDVPVVVLGANKGPVEKQQAVIADHGVTEVKPGSITAGASWDFPVGQDMTDAEQRLLAAYRTLERAKVSYNEALRNFYDPTPGPVVPFGWKPGMD